MHFDLWLQVGQGQGVQRGGSSRGSGGRQKKSLQSHQPAMADVLSFLERVPAFAAVAAAKMAGVALEIKADPKADPVPRLLLGQSG